MKMDKTVWLTEPDAERLSLMQKFVRSPLEGQHLVALERKISRASICAPAEVPADLVTMNSQVLLREAGTGEERVYTLVFPPVENARKNRISILGSLGRALLGARVGDVIAYLSSTGRRLQTVERLLYRPGTSGAMSGSTPKSNRGVGMRLFIHARGMVLTERLRSYVDRRLRLATGHYEGQLGDITVQLEDLNGHRGGVDKVCVITAEVPFAGRLVVEERGEGFMFVAFRAAHRFRDSIRERIKRRQNQESPVISNSLEAE